MRATLAFYILLIASSASADRALEPSASRADARVGAEPQSSAFWRAISHPSEERARLLVRQGRALLYPALGLGLLPGADVSLQKRLAVEASLARFERAVALLPSDREARLHYGKALAFWEDRNAEGALLDKSMEAIAQLDTLRKLDAHYEAQEVAFQLGLLHTRRGDYGRAVTEYRRALASRSDDEVDSALLGNLAEVTMLDGDLPGALLLYERAMTESEGGARILAMWGSSVALDRLGEHTAALARARRALQEDRAPFSVLHQHGVFFVPAHELHYYEALGNLALADKERLTGEPLSVLARAGQAWLRGPGRAASLGQFERVLAELDRGELRALTLSLRAAVARTRTLRHGGPPAVPEGLPAVREARVLLWLLRATALFDEYLRRDGGAGPFAEDAREHLRELQQSLSAD
ncbi:MAG: hypothetical protein JWN04_6837 [Myxococcaceae bacterium]|nr:hypothetical protein [Myxococcaceae bacterium]